MMHRDLHSASEHRYDLVVVGGGVYGVTLTLEAARRGLKPLLIERDDFGGATSWNSLRIVHGGLRYLQHADLRRFMTSVHERRWFCRWFPEWLSVLPCMMPLYSRGAKRPVVLRAALALNDTLSWRRNERVAPAMHVPRGRVLSPDETVRYFPMVERKGLRGSAWWYDVLMINANRVLMEMLRWACACGATVLNYTEARELLQSGDCATGVRAVDGVTGERIDFTGRSVINCAGPWSAQLAEQFGMNQPRLCHPALAFNVMLDRAPLSDAAVAVQPRRPNAPVYFLVPWGDRILAGTRHLPGHGGDGMSPPSAAQINEFIVDLNDAVPGLGLQESDVKQVFAGILPTDRPAGHEPSKRDHVIDHGRHGGPRRVVSVAGIKFTTARDRAERLLRALFAEDGGLPPYQAGSDRPMPRQDLNLTRADGLSAAGAAEWRAPLRRLIAEESVVHLDDLLWRRTDWMFNANPGDAPVIAQRVRSLLGDEVRAASPPLCDQLNSPRIARQVNKETVPSGAESRASVEKRPSR